MAALTLVAALLGAVLGNISGSMQSLAPPGGGGVGGWAGGGHGEGHGFSAAVLDRLCGQAEQLCPEAFAAAVARKGGGEGSGAGGGAGAGGGCGEPLGVPESQDADLRAVLEQVGGGPDGRDVMTALSNKALISADGKYGMLETFLTSVKRAGVKNFFLIALDDHTANAMRAIGVPYWRAPDVNTQGANDNHGISAKKYKLLLEILSLGYNVLLSDADVVALRDPFPELIRDSDVEGMTDAEDALRARGETIVMDEPEMGWSRYVYTNRIWAMNSGTFYVKSNARTVHLMQQIHSRLVSEEAWDQAVFNEELIRPSYGKHRSPQCSVRVAEMSVFANSKYVFKHLRYKRKDFPPALGGKVPALVHVNFHPDKWDRMKSVVARYVEGQRKALDPYPIGSCAAVCTPDCKPECIASNAGRRGRFL